MKMEDIERYVNGEMDAEELKDFEFRLHGDADLQEEVNRVANLISRLKLLGLSNKISEIQKINANKRNNNLYFGLGIIVSILLSMILFLLPYYNTVQSN